MPTVWSARANTMAFDLTCLATRQARSSAFCSAAPGARRVTTRRRRLRQRDAARIVVLDDHGGGRGELAHRPPGGVEVEEVVVRQLLALELPGARHGSGVLVGVEIEGRLLVRVLAIAQGQGAAE